MQTAEQWKPGIEGVFYGLSAEKYHAAPGFSHSMAKHMEPPARLPAYLLEREAPTKAMLMGTLVHQRILEPEKPLPSLAVKPEGMKFSTTEGKVWKAERENAGQTILTGDEYESIIGCVDAISKDERCNKIFANGLSEVSLFKTHAQTGTFCKSRLDWLSIGNFLVDIKKCLDGQSEPDSFSKLLYERRYYTQAAWYLAMWNALNPDDQRDHFIFITVEGVAPYLVNVFTVDSDAIKLGGERNIENLRAYAACCETKRWPGYGGYNEAGIPAWAKAKANDRAHKGWLESVGRAVA